MSSMFLTAPTKASVSSKLQPWLASILTTIELPKRSCTFNILSMSFSTSSPSLIFIFLNPPARYSSISAIVSLTLFIPTVTDVGRGEVFCPKRPPNEMFVCLQ